MPIVTSKLAILGFVLVCAGAPTSASAMDYVGGPGNDAFTGTASADNFFLYGGADVMNGRQGPDTVYAGTGNDWLLNGEQGADTIYGQDGSDTMYGGDSGDTLYAGCNPGCNLGNDQIYGGPGNDVIGAENGKYDGGDAEGGTGDHCYLDYPGLDVFYNCEFIH